MSTLSPHRHDAPCNATPRALYVHVPFCPHVCAYCDFHKMRRSEPLVATYLDRLVEEIADLGLRYGGPLDTLYLGGGTPSHLSDAELERVFTAVHEAFGGNARIETTLEADPLTFDAQRLAHFASLGVTRLSIGVQSLQDEVLRFLSRIHDARAARQAIDLALAAGFEVSADLITAIPGQDVDMDLRAFAETGVPHVSVYTLTIEPWTPFALRKIRVDEDRAARDYERAAEVLAAHGYARYEVSNHAKPGFEAKHNAVYWHGASFLAAGPSAAAYLPSDTGFGRRVTNPPIKAWLEQTPGEQEDLDAETYLLERFLTGLRTTRGVDLDLERHVTGIDPRERFAAVLNDATLAPLFERLARGRHSTQPDAGDTLRVRPEGLLVLDAILRRFAEA